MPIFKKHPMLEATNQIKDFFKDTSGTRVYPNNPHNVLWFIENTLSEQDMNSLYWQSYKKDIISCIKKNIIVEDNMNRLKNVMIEDYLVLKRIKDIVEKKCIDINSLDLATKAVRRKSDIFVEGLLNMGLNPNIENKKTQRMPLEEALKRKKTKIAMLYWNNIQLNRFALNKWGQNYAEIAVQSNNWLFFEKILNDEPSLVFGFDEKQKLNTEKLLIIFHRESYELNDKQLKQKEQKNLRNENYSVSIVPTKIKIIVIELIKYSMKHNVEMNITNESFRKLWKEAMYQNFKEKYIDKKMYKIKKTKI